MIGRVSGTLLHRASDHALIDVRGIGYIVHCNDRTLALLPLPGAPVTLYTDLLVREDLLKLFGFSTLAEKEWYRLLVTVQGVGAKAALAILGTLGPDGVGRAIALGDAAAVKAAPGVGPKIAQRVVNELKDKAPGVMAMALPAMAPTDGPGAAEGPPPAGLDAPSVAPPAPAAAASAAAEAMSALANLGYAPAEAAAAVSAAASEASDADTAALIRAALRRLAPKD